MREEWGKREGETFHHERGAIAGDTDTRPTLAHTYLNKISGLGIPCRHQAVYFILNLAFFCLVDGNIPFGQTGLALAILKKEESNLHMSNEVMRVAPCHG